MKSGHEESGRQCRSQQQYCMYEDEEGDLRETEAGFE